MKTLNERFDYGLDLVLISIDEGITGYRDDSLETVKRNRDQYGLPLTILSYEELYGWTRQVIMAAKGMSDNTFRDSVRERWTAHKLPTQ